MDSFCARTICKPVLISKCTNKHICTSRKNPKVPPRFYAYHSILGLHLFSTIKPTRPHTDSFPPKLDRPPWFTNQLQRLRNLKTNFFKKFIKSGRPTDFSRYVMARNNFNVLNSHCYSMYLNR